MYEQLKAKFAPLRNKRHPQLRGSKEEHAWVETLEWKHNEYDFYRLRQSMLGQMDSSFREHWGMRVDQLASQEEIQGWFRESRTRFLELIKDDPPFERLGPCFFLDVSVRSYLQARAKQILEIRGKDQSKLTFGCYKRLD